MDKHFPGALNALVRFLDKALAVLLGTLVGVLASGVIVSVILRYLFGVSFAWAEELMTMIFIATTFFGAALGLREGEHIAITLPSEGRPLRRRVLSILVQLSIVVVSSFVFKYSRVWIARVGAVPSPATGIPNGSFYTMVPVSFGITIFYAAVRILSEFVPIDPPATKSRFDGEADPAGGGEG